MILRMFDPNEYAKQYYQDNKDRLLAQLRERRQAKLDYIESRRDRCVDCGITDKRVLEFDHVNGYPEYRKPRQRRSLADMGWKKLKADLDSCEVRCANCHKIRHSKDGTL